MTKVRPLTNETQIDAAIVVRNRFPEEAIAVLDKILSNPARNIRTEAGVIVYENNQPVCFEASILRRLYYDSQFVWGSVGGMTCIKRDAAVEALIDLKRSVQVPTEWNKILFANSQNVESAYIAKRNKFRVMGPESCTRFRWRMIRPLECLAYFVRRKLLKGEVPAWKDFSTLNSAGFVAKYGELTIRRLMEIKSDFYDILMTRYLERNKGLVCSRTAEEIEWIFGERIRRGESVVLGVFDDRGPFGYIVIDGKKSSKRWIILDWFAVDNDLNALESLLAVACKFLKRYTPAMLLEVCGFPLFAQSVLKKYLPHIRRLDNNTFSMGTRDAALRERFRDMVAGRDACWFFGPYDGDACLCM